MASPDRTHVVVSHVSGEHGDKNPVPYPPLMKELAQLAANRRRYASDPLEDLRDAYQPQRIDLDPPVAGKEVQYVEVSLRREGIEG
jgi:hypothetical protein